MSNESIKILYAKTQAWYGLKGGGSITHTLGVLNGFVQNGCDVRLISNEYFPKIKNFDYSLICIGFRQFSKKRAPILLFLYNLYALKKFKKEILRFKPDFIYHRSTAYTFFVSMVAKKLNIPLILEFNGFESWIIKHWRQQGLSYGIPFMKYILSRIVKAIEIFNIKRASIIVAVSRPLKNDLIKWNIPENKILVNPNGVDPDRFNPGTFNDHNLKRLRIKLNIPENGILVGWIGSFGIWHGTIELAGAIRQIASKNLIKNIHFLLVGEGIMKKRVESLVGEYKNVTFSGEIPYAEIPGYLAACDVLVSPHFPPRADDKEFFGSPTKIFEYMAMAKGIVASELGQIGEVLKNEKTAILIRPGNINELVAGILRLAENKKLREKLGKNAREEVIRNYTWQKNAERVIKKFNSDDWKN